MIIKAILIVAGVMLLGIGGMITAICVGIHSTTHYE